MDRPSVVLDVGGLGACLAIRTPSEQSCNVPQQPASPSALRSRRHRPPRDCSRSATPALTVATGDVAVAVAALPLDTLRILIEDDEPSRLARSPRAGRSEHAARMKATVARLDTIRRWGLATLGEMAALPMTDLSERMGTARAGAAAAGTRHRYRRRCAGSRRARGSCRSIELEWPIDALEPLSFVLARLLDPLSSALERADRGAAALRLDLRLVDRTTHTRVLQLPAAHARSAKVLRTLLLSISNRIPVDRASTSSRLRSIPRRGASCSTRCSSARCRRRKRWRR
jgi:hypothetical protein